MTDQAKSYGGYSIVYQQIQYAKDRPRGYDPNLSIISRARSDAFAAFKQEVMESGVVSNVTRSADPQTDPNDNFKGNDGADSGSAIINETAVRRMRLKQPLNQYLDCSFHGAPHRLRIVGVVKDALTQNPSEGWRPILRSNVPGRSASARCWGRRVTISPLVFVTAATVALVITAITVGFQSVRSAMQNPVAALRSE